MTLADEPEHPPIRVHRERSCELRERSRYKSVQRQAQLDWIAGYGHPINSAEGYPRDGPAKASIRSRILQRGTFVRRLHWTSTTERPERPVPPKDARQRSEDGWHLLRGRSSQCSPHNGKPDETGNNNSSDERYQLECSETSHRTIPSSLWSRGAKDGPQLNQCGELRR
jgi:hypothetical protein